MDYVLKIFSIKGFDSFIPLRKRILLDNSNAGRRTASHDIQYIAKVVKMPEKKLRLTETVHGAG